MKKVLFTLSISFFLVVGCTTEESRIDSEETNANLVSRMQIDDLSQSTEIDLNDLRALFSTNGATANQRNPSNASANGHFTSPLGTTITFSAIQNNGGVHGQGLFVNENQDLHLETTCVSVDGNVAVFLSKITASNLEGFPWGVDNTLVLWVEDHGEGANAEADRFSSTLFVIPPGQPEELYVCSNWLDCGGNCFTPAIEVAGQGDQIQVR